MLNGMSIESRFEENLKMWGFEDDIFLAISTFSNHKDKEWKF